MNDVILVYLMIINEVAELYEIFCLLFGQAILFISNLHNRKKYNSGQGSNPKFNLLRVQYYFDCNGEICLIIILKTDLKLQMFYADFGLQAFKHTQKLTHTYTHTHTVHIIHN